MTTIREKLNLNYEDWQKGFVLYPHKFKILPFVSIPQTFKAYINNYEYKGNSPGQTLRNAGIANVENYLTIGGTGQEVISFTLLEDNIIDSNLLKKYLFNQHLALAEDMLLLNFRNAANNWKILSQTWAIQKGGSLNLSQRALLNAFISCMNLFVSGQYNYMEVYNNVQFDQGSFGTINLTVDQETTALEKMFGQVGISFLNQSYIMDPYNEKQNNIHDFITDFYDDYFDYNILEKLKEQIKEIAKEELSIEIDRQGLALQTMDNLILPSFPQTVGTTQVGVQWNNEKSFFELVPLDNTQNIASRANLDVIGWYVEPQVFTSTNEAWNNVKSRVDAIKSTNNIEITHNRDGLSVENTFGGYSLSSLSEVKYDLIVLNKVEEPGEPQEIYYSLIRIQKLNDLWEIMPLSNGLGGNISTISGVWRTINLSPADYNITENKSFEVNLGLNLNTVIQSIRMEFEFLPVMDEFIENKINPIVSGTTRRLSTLPMVNEISIPASWTNGTTINTFVNGTFSNFVTISTNITSSNTYEFLANFDIEMKPKGATGTDMNILQINFGEIKEVQSASQFSYSYRETSGDIVGRTTTGFDSAQRYKIRIKRVEYLAPSDIAVFIQQLVNFNTRLTKVEDDVEKFITDSNKQINDLKTDNIQFKEDTTTALNNVIDSIEPTIDAKFDEYLEVEGEEVTIDENGFIKVV